MRLPYVPLNISQASQVCGRDGSCSPTARDDPWLGSRESYTSDAAGSAHVSIHLRQSQVCPSSGLAKPTTTRELTL